ncbi:MarR family winged helix-turn-helix transcriptional regulator [Nocardioides aequoreus]|uniref:MarR family winged helix-turn-helix transcriptional regulator n=1 Tax=Nocardioides aequoreus TaxID=397278 RepID=UPI0006920CA3|nr:MarR family transcriptional regulator [Nocardioides aequoreus]
MAREVGHGAAGATDAIDVALAQWARERPDLDARPMSVVGRLHRLGDLWEGELRTFFAEAGLGNGDFDVLASLRRAGAPYRMSPGQLAASTIVTSGAVSKRVDRLEARGLVRRTVCADDARGRDVQLTDEGVRFTDELVARHWANEERLLGALDEGEQEQLVGLLRRLLVDLEGPADVPD